MQMNQVRPGQYTSILKIRRQDIFLQKFFLFQYFDLHRYSRQSFNYFNLKSGQSFFKALFNDVCMYVCKVFCPKAGPSLDMHYQGITYILVYQIKEMSEVVCQVLSLQRQWPYGKPFIAHTDTTVLQIQLLSIPIPQIAPKLSQP